ncbi:chorismate synthase [Ichthyobacterium seriolicida]|uniref:Chorismate synthase n=1 Tax=Ichthyobacterium seriolicida TaxID=242600 RepID=A0A1J1DYW6_9FLAO|nr:chorismate synthase [Ichthyobacterium seriolicida]
MGNTFGRIFRLTSFGESHGRSVGGIVDGVPPGITIDISKIQRDLDRRRPGQSSITTSRKELDQVVLLSGIFEQKTTGMPIGFLVENRNHKSEDYDHIKDIYRPSHADFTYDKKYGHRDYRGGGRSSARETISRVIGGSIAKQFLNDISISAYVSSVGSISLDKPYYEYNLSEAENSIVRCPDLDKSKEMISLIEEVKKSGDTIGGVVSCVIKNVPIGLGEPVFDKLHAVLGKAMLSINAVKGFEYGSGFEGTKMLGSKHNDLFVKGGGTKTNFSGGIQGGISNGEDIYFRVAFKPVATIMQDQISTDKNNENINIVGRGRHDPCVVPRAVPIVESMAAMVIADYILLNAMNILN